MAESRAALGTIEYTVFFETGDEYFLNGVIEVAQMGRRSPASGEVGADDRSVFVRERFSIGRAASRGGFDDGPTGGIG